MRSAFTMIELIFVIVILGILAAVAIPKLSATRVDAEASKIAFAAMTSVEEIASSVVASGMTQSDLSKMSNIITELVVGGQATLDLTNKSVDIKAGEVDNCVTIAILSSATDESVTIVFGTPGTDQICLGVQSIIDQKKYPIKVRGIYVKQ